MTDPQILCEIDHVEDWAVAWTEQEYRVDFESRVMFLQILRWKGHGKMPFGIAYCLILEPTGNLNEFWRRGVAEVPDGDGMADDGWETQRVNIV